MAHMKVDISLAYFRVLPGITEFEHQKVCDEPNSSKVGALLHVRVGCKLQWCKNNLGCRRYIGSKVLFSASKRCIKPAKKCMSLAQIRGLKTEVCMAMQKGDASGQKGYKLCVKQIRRVRLPSSPYKWKSLHTSPHKWKRSHASKRLGLFRLKDPILGRGGVGCSLFRCVPSPRFSAEIPMKVNSIISGT